MILLIHKIITLRLALRLASRFALRLASRFASRLASRGPVRLARSYFMYVVIAGILIIT